MIKHKSPIVNGILDELAALRESPSQKQRLYLANISSAKILMHQLEMARLRKR